MWLVGSSSMISPGFKNTILQNATSHFCPSDKYQISVFIKSPSIRNHAAVDLNSCSHISSPAASLKQSYTV
jgi:hypothetical protein